MLDENGGPAGLFTDPVRLAQVFTNLLNNAAKYTNPDGHIELTVEALPGEYVVRIRGLHEGKTLRLIALTG